jgi:hypothetical protein
VPENIAEGYDAFNDRRLRRTHARQLPPMLGRRRRRGDRRKATPIRNREARASTATAACAARAGAQPSARANPPISAASARGTRRRLRRGKRKAEPAWSRLGLQPDPTTPASFRDSLTGASITPPPADLAPSPPAETAERVQAAQRDHGPAPSPVAACSRMVIAVLLALRIPTGLA